MLSPHPLPWPPSTAAPLLQQQPASARPFNFNNETPAYFNNETPASLQLQQRRNPRAPPTSTALCPRPLNNNETPAPAQKHFLPTKHLINLVLVQLPLLGLNRFGRPATDARNGQVWSLITPLLSKPQGQPGGWSPTTHRAACVQPNTFFLFCC